MKATLIAKLNETRSDGIRIEVVVWQLPAPDQYRPHGIKYRLWAGRSGKTIVRYDNETGKGDHKHIGELETEAPYEFVSVEQLMRDFLADVDKEN